MTSVILVDNDEEALRLVRTGECWLGITGDQTQTKVFCPFVDAGRSEYSYFLPAIRGLVELVDVGLYCTTYPIAVHEVYQSLCDSIEDIVAIEDRRQVH